MCANTLKRYNATRDVVCFSTVSTFKVKVRIRCLRCLKFLFVVLHVTEFFGISLYFEHVVSILWPHSSIAQIELLVHY